MARLFRILANASSVMSERTLTMSFPASIFHSSLCPGDEYVQRMQQSTRPNAPKKVYIAGKMNGMPNLNREAFANAEERLKKMGFDAVNPHVINEKMDYLTEKVERMKNDIRHLIDCTHIYLLPGWEDSRGATLEKQIADYLGISPVQLDP